MTKAVSRLFRNPADAEHAVKALISAGIPASKIGVLAKSETTVKSVLKDGVSKVYFSGVGNLVVAGSLAPSLSKASGAESKLASTLAGTLGLAHEAGEYYEFVLGAEGVLVAVDEAEGKAAEARKILAKADAAPTKSGVTSPGFYEAARMSATNPVDAAMTGDFRKY
ncbi:MAG: hypothetical protein HYX87_05775 [Chloroflexi bacterium]|nr:hypothetical protein [Chloroflexota bacterium]